MKKESPSHVRGNAWDLFTRLAEEIPVQAIGVYLRAGTTGPELGEIARDWTAARKLKGSTNLAPAVKIWDGE